MQGKGLCLVRKFSVIRVTEWVGSGVCPSWLSTWANGHPEPQSLLSKEGWLRWWFRALSFLQVSIGASSLIPDSPELQWPFLPTEPSSWPGLGFQPFWRAQGSSIWSQEAFFLVWALPASALLPQGLIASLPGGDNDLLMSKHVIGLNEAWKCLVPWHFCPSCSWCQSLSSVGLGRRHGELPVSRPCSVTRCLSSKWCPALCPMHQASSHSGNNHDDDIGPFLFSDTGLARAS